MRTTREQRRPHFEPPDLTAARRSPGPGRKRPDRAAGPRRPSAGGLEAALLELTAGTGVLDRGDDAMGSEAATMTGDLLAGTARNNELEIGSHRCADRSPRGAPNSHRWQSARSDPVRDASTDDGQIRSHGGSVIIGPRSSPRRSTGRQRIKRWTRALARVSYRRHVNLPFLCLVR